METQNAELKSAIDTKATEVKLATTSSSAATDWDEGSRDEMKALTRKKRLEVPTDAKVKTQVRVYKTLALALGLANKAQFAMARGSAGSGVKEKAPSLMTGYSQNKFPTSSAGIRVTDINARWSPFQAARPNGTWSYGWILSIVFGCATVAVLICFILFSGTPAEVRP
jgi:hypothetical protein